MLSDTASRLKPYGKAVLLRGDSFDIVPQLLQQHAGQRIGIFVDGPKNIKGLRLCINAFHQAPEEVYFCALHDVYPGPGYDSPPYLWDLFESWGRTVLLSYQKGWRTYYRAMDVDIPAYEGYDKYKETGMGLAILGGKCLARMNSLSLDIFV